MAVDNEEGFSGATFAEVAATFPAGVAGKVGGGGITSRASRYAPSGDTKSPLVSSQPMWECHKLQT